MEKIRLITGLGNPGRKYEKTYHNLGLRTLNFLITSWKAKLFSSNVLPVKVYQDRSLGLLLAKPLIYVNLTGPVIKQLLKRYKIEPEEILVISDDFSLPFGTIRIRKMGSAGGHKGLASIITALGTNKFPRLRIGCGLLPQGVDAKDYVLSPLTREEENELNFFFPQISGMIEKICTNGLEKTMSLYNKKSLLNVS